MSAQHLSHQSSGHLPFAWLPGQGRRQPAARPGAGPGMGAEPMDWHRQGVSTLDLRSRPPRQRGAHRRGRDSPGHLAAGQPWPGSMGTSVSTQPCPCSFYHCTEPGCKAGYVRSPG
jgi:hypothetical protein